MNRALFSLSFLFVLLFSTLPVHAQSTHSLGFGAHYWRVIDDIDATDFEESGLSYILAYRYDGGLLAVQAELEGFPSDFGTAPDAVYSPQVLAILGDGLYAGIGAGILYSDGEFADEPFFLLRAGFNIFALGPIVLDLNANYVFTNFDSFSSSDLSSDTITLGAMVRVDF